MYSLPSNSFGNFFSAKAAEQTTPTIIAIPPKITISFLTVLFLDQNKGWAIALVFNSLGYGLLCFPKTNEDKPDYSEVIIIKDNEGIEFLKEMWDYFWSKGKIYS